jgi:phage-related minor tail protein
MGLGWKRDAPPGDPWRQALDRHIAGQPTEPLPAAAATPHVRRRLFTALLAGGAALIVILLAGCAYLGYLAMENDDRADRWQDRSTAEHDLVETRTQALNRQTARLNVASTRLRDARRALARSERDAEALATRQRELASEKAQVEDQRAALEVRQAALTDVANSLNSCSIGLAGLVDTFAQGFYPSTGEYESAASECQAAEAAVDSYVGGYSGE